jgi:hypothetical protein
MSKPANNQTPRTHPSHQPRIAHDWRGGGIWLVGDSGSRTLTDIPQRESELTFLGSQLSPTSKIAN